MADEIQNPQAEAVRAEVKDIMTNPQNPHHEGWKRNDPAVRDHVDGLYSKLAGADRKVSLSDGMEAWSSGEPEPHNDLVITELRSMNETPEELIPIAQAVAREMFPDRNMLAEAAGAIAERYGAKGEALALKFLASLSREKGRKT